jgi:(4S)-4-hydroxy-5-phosphonooxypentane-2,3-dione isomerase
MIATVVNIWVRAPYLQQFIDATYDNHINSIREPGNLRFDILQDAADHLKFTFYEVYESEDAVAAHKGTSHYLRWKETVEPWMAKPRQGVKHGVVFPTDIKQW